MAGHSGLAGSSNAMEHGALNLHLLQHLNFIEGFLLGHLPRHKRPHEVRVEGAAAFLIWLRSLGRALELALKVRNLGCQISGCLFVLKLEIVVTLRGRLARLGLRLDLIGLSQDRDALCCLGGLFDLGFCLLNRSTLRDNFLCIFRREAVLGTAGEALLLVVRKVALYECVGD